MATVKNIDRNIGFEAVLYPQRSLSHFGFMLLMSVLSGLSFLIGIMFFLKGAWPVFGFLGLDVALVYGAFRIHYRSGRAAEVIRLSPQELKIIRITAKGEQREWVFNPYWVTVSMACPPHVPKNLGESFIQVRSHGRGVFLGLFLRQEERVEVMESLKQALRDCRNHRALSG